MDGAAQVAQYSLQCLDCGPADGSLANCASELTAYAMSGRVQIMANMSAADDGLVLANGALPVDGVDDRRCDGRGDHGSRGLTSCCRHSESASLDWTAAAGLTTVAMKSLAVGVLQGLQSLMPWRSSSAVT